MKTITLLVNFDTCVRGTKLIYNPSTGNYDIPTTPCHITLEDAMARPEIFKVSSHFEVNCDCEAFAKLVDAIEKTEVTEGDKYSFYQVSDNTWRRATFEKTATDIGRLMGGFIISYPTNANQKFNRLTKLNEVYGLGLSKEQIKAASQTGYNS